MTSNNSIQKMWQDFKEIQPDAPETYEAWAFGDSKEMAGELAALVLEGTKTATASNYSMYEEDEELPYVGLYNIILNGEGQAIAVAVTTSVEIVPFDQVTEEHAYLEGEGDRSLEYWREVHEDFFVRELEEAGQRFHENIPVVCERFEVIYS